MPTQTARKPRRRTTPAPTTDPVPHATLEAAMATVVRQETAAALPTPPPAGWAAADTSTEDSGPNLIPARLEPEPPKDSPPTPSLSLPHCPRCHGTGTVEWRRDNGRCFRCRGKGTPDHADLERNRIADVATHGARFVALLKADVGGVPRTKPVAFARTTEVFRVDPDGKVEAIEPKDVRVGDRLAYGSKPLDRLIEVEVLEVTDKMAGAF